MGAAVTANGMPAEVLADVVAALRRVGATGVVDVAGRVDRPPVVMAHRPRCSLYGVALTDGSQERRVVVKIRHADPQLRRVDRYADRRPILTPERIVSVAEAARHEYEGLRLIERTFRTADPARFGVLRPLALLPEHAAVVMDFVAEPTLRRQLVGRRPPPEAPLRRVWHNAGGWLRAFHRAGADLPRPRRTPDARALARGCAERAEFLAGTGPDSSAARALGTAAAETAAELGALPLAAGHGDFTPVNVFLGAGGRVTVFDPMPLWQVPVYEDLARMTVGVRGLRSAALGGGLSPSTAAALDRWEEVFLRGYFGADPVPYAAVRAFQALLLLDRWGELRSKQVRGSRMRRLRRDVRVSLTERYYRREASRLTRLLRAPA